MMNHIKRYISSIATHFPLTVVRTRYLLRFGKFPNLKRPKDLNEKILYLKLFTDTSHWSKLADKFNVRSYVKACGLEQILIPLYGNWENAEEIPFEYLPENFMLKSNNGDGRGTYLAVRNRSSLSAEKIQEIRNKVNSWFSTVRITALSAELHYKHIPPMIIAEKLLPVDRKLGCLVDYKFWCFAGKPHSILCCIDRDVKGNVALGSYDLEWNLHTEHMQPTKHCSLQQQPIPRPECLEEMIRVASILSKPFPEVRVDLYQCEGKVYFGELTFTSLAGMMNYYTPSYLYEMGKLVRI